VTGLDAEKAKELEKPAANASEATLKLWSAKAEVMIRKAYGQMGEQSLQVLMQALPQAEQTAHEAFIPNVPKVTEHPLWTEALKGSLTPDQAQLWAKHLDERKAKATKEVAEMLKPMFESSVQEGMQPLLARSGEIKRALSLPEEKGAKLDALAKSAVEKSVGKLKARLEKMLLSSDDRPRMNILEQSSFFGDDEVGLEPEDPQAAWKAGLAKILTPEEMKTVEGAKQERQQRRVHALGRLLISELDDKIAFTSQQRQKIEPIAFRLIKEQPELVPEDGRENVNLQLQSLFAAGTKAKEEEMRTILDPIQWRHWQEACDPKAIANANRDPAADLNTAKSEPGAATPEVEEVEKGLSDYLYKRSEIRRKSLQAEMTLKAEDAGRVTALAEPAKSRLQTAALGTAEVAMYGWRKETEEMVRSNLGDPNAGSLRQRLANMGDYYFQREVGTPMEKHAYWEATVRDVLSSPQQAAWKVEVEARRGYREEVVPAVVLSEFDRKHPLTNEQWTQLEPKIKKLVKDYGADFSSYYSSNQGTPWYLHYYLVYLPFAGIPDAEMKAVLAKDQWDQWTQSNEHSNIENMWSNIKQNHDQRVRVQKR